MIRFAVMGLVSAMLTLAATALAQPLRDAEELDPAVVIASLREAYQREAFAEEITARVRAAGRLRIDRIEVRGDATGESARVWLSLGDLDVAVHDGRLVAANRRDVETFVARTLGDGPLTKSLADILPPVPAPQVELALGDDATFSRPLPYLRDVQWISASRPLGRAAAIDDAITVLGQGPHGQVTLLVDPATSRLRMLKTDIVREDGATAVEIELRFTALVPGDPAAWVIDTTDRRELASLTDLRPSPPRLRPGAVVPDPSTYTAGMEISSLLDPLREHDRAGEADLTMVLVLYVMPPVNENPIEIERAAKEALLASHQAAIARLPNPTILSPIAVFGLSVFDPATVRGIGERWADPIDAAVRETGVDVAPIRWTGFVRDAVMGHDPKARLVVAHVAHDLTLLGSVVIDPQSDAEAIRQRVREMLWP